MGDGLEGPVIDVERVRERDGSSTFHVRVTDDRSSATFDVTLSRPDGERLAVGYATEETFIRACFGFLLEREPKESILRSFDVGVISTYFPEFEREIASPLG